MGTDRPSSKNISYPTYKFGKYEFHDGVEYIYCDCHPETCTHFGVRKAKHFYNRKVYYKYKKQ